MDSARASPGELALIAVLGFTIVGGSALVFVRNTEPPAPPIRKVAAPRPSATPTEDIFVHVAGLVKAPGVYRLTEGSRVKDAIDAAGGSQDGADLESLNLAAKLADGEKVMVMAPGQVPPAAAGVAAGGPAGTPAKTNLNTATPAQLEELPSIGPVLAERIVAHRQTKGNFTSIKQLMEVSGVGPKKFEGLKDLVTV
ncbi:MAG: helix-hairpin-helix domain-containing protein [Actinomycetota bacterium]